MITKELHTSLRRTGRVTLMTNLARSLLMALALLVAAALAAIAVDAMLTLAPWQLITADSILAVVAVAALVRLAWVWYRNRFHPRRLARLIEERVGIRDSALINAVDLSFHDTQMASGDLVELAVARGSAVALGIPARQVADLARLRRAASAALVALAVAAAAYLVLPDVFRAVVPRLLEPAASHAPFTLVRFEVTIEPEKVYVGRPAAIHVALSGHDLPDQATVVFTDEAAQRAPMLHSGDGRFALRLAEASRSRTFYIDTPSGRSSDYTLTVLPVPTFRKIVVSYAFPSYTDWGTRRTGLDVMGLRAIEGTTVTLAIESNCDLRMAELTLTPDPPAAGSTAPTPQVVTLNPSKDDPKTVSGSFTLASSGQYSLSLTGADGMPGNEVKTGPVVAQLDARPEVQCLDPAADIIAPSNWTVPLAFAASDDVKVQRLTLSRMVNGWGPYTEDLVLETTDPRYARAACQLDLAALGASGGDVITYFATAQDNYPAGPHAADSPVYVIQVVDQEEYAAYARTKYRMEQVLRELDEFRREAAQIEEMRKELIQEFEALKKKLEAQGGKPTDEDTRRLDELDKKYGEYADKSKRLAEKLRQRADQPQIYEFEKTYSETLRQMAEGLEQTGQAVGEVRRSKPALTPPEYTDKALEQLRQAEPPAQERAAEMKLTEEQLDRLRRAADMAGLANRITGIALQQKELADRLAQFRNKEKLSPAEQLRAQQLAEEQAQLEKDLTATLDELEKQARKSEQDLPNMSQSALGIIKDIRAMKVEQDQAQASQLARAGQGRYAHRSAQDAADKLASMIKECNGQGGEGEQDLDGQLQLTRSQIAMALQQLAQGMMPGAGSGRGGQGTQGSQASRVLVGPHGGSGDADAREGRGDRGKGRGRPDSGSIDRPAAEQLNPAQATARSGAGGGMPGVPLRFRGLAEQYFRRLADDSK